MQSARFFEERIPLEFSEERERAKANTDASGDIPRVFGNGSGGDNSFFSFFSGAKTGKRVEFSGEVFLERFGKRAGEYVASAVSEVFAPSIEARMIGTECGE